MATKTYHLVSLGRSGVTQCFQGVSFPSSKPGAPVAPRCSFLSPDELCLTPARCAGVRWVQRVLRAKYLNIALGAVTVIWFASCLVLSVP